MTPAITPALKGVRSPARSVARLTGGNFSQRLFPELPVAGHVDEDAVSGGTVDGHAGGEVGFGNGHFDLADTSAETAAIHIILTSVRVKSDKCLCHCRTHLITQMSEELSKKLLSIFPVFLPISRNCAKF